MSPETLWQLQGEKKKNTPPEKKKERKFHPNRKKSAGIWREGRGRVKGWLLCWRPRWFCILCHYFLMMNSVVRSHSFPFSLCDLTLV